MATTWPSALVEAIYERERDVRSSYRAYRRYKRGRTASDLEEAFRNALPVVRDICKGTQDRDLLSAAAWQVFHSLRCRYFKRGNTRRYWAYLRQVALGGLINAYRDIRRFNKKLIAVDFASTQFIRYDLGGHIVSHDEIEWKIIVEKLPVLVVEDVLDRMPYEGEERFAAMYILRSLVAGHDVVPQGLAVLFDVSKSRLRDMIDYVIVAIRMSLTRLRRELAAADTSGPYWKSGVLSVHEWLYSEMDPDVVPPGSYAS